MLLDLAKRAARHVKAAIERADVTTVDMTAQNTDSRSLILKYSKARLVMGITNIEPQALRDRKAGEHKRAPRPTKFGVNMLNGEPMRFFDDGSLRHVLSPEARRRAHRAARKATAKAAYKAAHP